MEQRINDLCEALSQFYLGIVPMAAGIQDDLGNTEVPVSLTFTQQESLVKTIDEADKLNRQLWLAMWDIRKSLVLMEPHNRPASVSSAERKVKSPPTAEDALKSLQGLSAEDIAKLLGGLK